MQSDPLERLHPIDSFAWMKTTPFNLLTNKLDFLTTQPNSLSTEIRPLEIMSLKGPDLLPSFFQMLASTLRNSVYQFLIGHGFTI